MFRLPRSINPGLLIIVIFGIAGEIDHFLNGTPRTATTILCLLFWCALGLDTLSHAFAIRHARVDHVGMFRMAVMILLALIWGPFAHRLFRT